MDARVTTVRDIVYRTVDGAELHLDLHRPDTPEPVPAVVYLHGGGFEIGERTDREENRAMAIATQGVAVATVQYRFSSQAVFPAQLDDARAAVDWVRANGARHGLLTDKVGAWGASAGAHLAALLGVGSPSTDVAPAVEAVVTWFPVLDLEARFTGAPLDDQLAPPSSERGLLGSTVFDRDDPRMRAASPILNVSAQSAPFLLMTGDRDRIVDPAQNARFHDALMVAGGSSTLTIVGGAGHEDPVFESEIHVGLVAAHFRVHLGESGTRHHAPGS